MQESLQTPTEPEEIKNMALYMWVEIGRVRLAEIAINPESEDVWHGTQLAEYLWGIWRKDLSKRGFSERLFHQLMRYRTDDILLWAYDRISWGELLNRITRSAEGDLGKAIVEGRPL